MRLFDILLQDRTLRSDLDQVKNRPRFVLDNVADYYYYENLKEFWALKDFPYPMPPFDKLWFEYRLPIKSVSKERGTTSLYDLLPNAKDFRIYIAGLIDKLPNNQWKCIMSWHLVEKDTLVQSEVNLNFTYDLSPEDEHMGAIYTRGNYSDEDLTNRMYSFHPVAMAFSLMNCKNVETLEVAIPEKLQKARIKKHKEPLTNYHVINVLPMNVHKTVTKKVYLGDTTLTSLGNITIRRGSYAFYGPKYNRGRLFGKYEGVYWRPSSLTKSDEETFDVRVKGHKTNEDKN